MILRILILAFAVAACFAGIDFDLNPIKFSSQNCKLLFKFKRLIAKQNKQKGVHFIR